MNRGTVAGFSRFGETIFEMSTSKNNNTIVTTEDFQ
jgi:hypothetical protein